MPSTDGLYTDLGSGQWAQNVKLTGSNATKAVVVTPNDSTDLPDGATKGIYVGGAGDVKATMADGSVVTFKSLSVGIVHPLSVKRVWSTATTATQIVAVY